MNDRLSLAGCLLLACGCAPAGGPAADGGSEPRLVAPGVISTSRHENFPAIDPVDGSLWFSVYDGEAFNRQTLVRAPRQGSGWGAPAPVVFPADDRWGARAPRFSADGRTLYFTSNRPRSAGDARTDMNIWMAERTAGGWSAPMILPEGKDPGYDPLAFAIQEAHARGMELHAWINPFRAGNTADSAQLAPSHVFRSRRELARVYGTNLWMDPGEPEAQEHSIRVVADIVRRYDIDGIHADDYFYPYVQNDASGRPIPFPDDSTYARYGGGVDRGDWRRANIDRFVERLYREVHAIKPTLKVGLSPFGIWRPGHPPGVQGLDAYASIYADSRKWLQQGWVDYLAPQLYWSIAAPQQSYPALLDWWFEQNARGRHVWPGLAAYRVNNGTSSAFSMQEIPDQIRLTRARPAGRGHILYNTTWTLRRNNGALATTLASELYQSAALVPASPWLDATPPPTPTVTVLNGAAQITPGDGEPVRWWAVRWRISGKWTARVLFASERTVNPGAEVDRVLVQAVDQAGNLSAAAEWRR